METQLNEQLVYSGDTLLGNDQPSFCSDASKLPELKLKDGNCTFPDNLTSAVNYRPFESSSGTLQTISLPGIENYFVASSVQDHHHQLTSRYHPYTHSPIDETKGFVESSRYEEVYRAPFQPLLSSNPQPYDQYQSAINVGVHYDEDKLLTSSVESNLPLLSGQETQQQWLTTSTSYVMNSNNNNINQSSLHNIVGQQATYYDLKNIQVSSEHESALPVTSLASISPYKQHLTTKPNFANIHLASGEKEIIGGKLSPDGKKKTKRRKKRGPNEPQKPVSAYALFFRDTQANIKLENPSATFGEISKIVASLWDGLNEEDKQNYKQKTELAKRDYLKQLAAFRANLVSKGGIETEQDDIPQITSVFKTNEQASVSSFHHPNKIHLLQTNIRDMSSHQTNQGFISNSSADKLATVNFLYQENNSFQIGEHLPSQMPATTTHEFIVTSSSETSQS